MPRPLGAAVGERLELPVLYADSDKDFAHAREFWKLERGQAFAEPGNASWEAFASGDWDESLCLIEDLREDLTRYHRDAAGGGTSTYRVRIVSLPPTAYIQWELHVLRLRDETGGLIRILLDTAVADLEDQGALPDIQTMDRDVMYQPIYDVNGVAEYGLRYTDKALVSRCRDFIADLYARGEPIEDFFRREIAHLPSPQSPGPVLPRDYLKRTGRLRPVRS
ncbi:MAG: DUF6879 family protein [Trebonia sp.]